GGFLVGGSVNDFEILMNGWVVFDGERFSAGEVRNWRSFFVPGGGRASVIGQRALHDVAHVGRKRRRCRYPPQSNFGPRAPSRLEHAPTLERRQKPRRDPPILGGGRQHRVDHEIVAGAVGAVELLLVPKRKGVDQGAYTIGIGK